MAIRTPRPLDPRGGLLTKVSETFTRQIEKDRAAGVAEEAAAFEREGVLQSRQLERNRDVRAEAQSVRSMGFEDVVEFGLEDRPPALSITPRRGPLSRQAPESRVGVAGSFALPQREIAGADQRLTQRTRRVRLEPARDPSIVHPELLDRPGGAEEQDFGELDNKMGLPPGTLGNALRTAPGAVINAVQAFNRAEGAERQQQLVNVRQAINTTIAGLKVRAENQPATGPEAGAVFDEIEALAQVLLDLTISQDAPASQTLAEVSAQVQGLDLTDEEKAAIVTKYFERLNERQKMFRQFSPEGGRREPLEPPR